MIRFFQRALMQFLTKKVQNNNNDNVLGLTERKLSVYFFSGFSFNARERYE